MKNACYRPLLGLITALLVSACASAPPRATPPSPASAPPERPSQDDALPGVSLDSDVLYHILLGEIAGQRGQMDVAAANLGKVAEHTRDPRLAERATLAALYAKRYQDALKSAQLWVALRPDQSEAREALAGVLLELNRPAEARAQLEHLLSIAAERGGLEQAYMRIVAVLGRHSNRSAALEVMQGLVARYPQVAVAHFAMAHLAVRAGDLDHALASADQALALRPDWEDAALFKARILVSQKDMLRAQSFYESFLDRHPTATGMRINYARHLIDQKQWEKARAQFKRVIADIPDDVDAVYALGLLSLQINRPEDAENYLRRVLELRPDHDQARIYLGQVAEQRKQFDVAEHWYREIGPGEQYFEAQARIGIILARQGKLGAARRHLHSITPDNEPQQAQLVLAEEQVLREAKQYAEALKVMNDAVTAMPANTDLRYARALIAEKLGMLELMESDLREILTRDPNNAHALNALGYTLADRTNRYKEAQELLNQAMVLRPDDAFILDSMGWLQYRLGNNAEAIRYLKRAIEIRGDAEIAAHLGEVLWVTGNRQEAESVWNRALRDTPDNEALIDVIKKFKP